jgi:hypothetical protein
MKLLLVHIFSVILLHALHQVQIFSALPTPYKTTGQIILLVYFIVLRFYKGDEKTENSELTLILILVLLPSATVLSI